MLRDVTTVTGRPLTGSAWRWKTYAVVLPLSLVLTPAVGLLVVVRLLIGATRSLEMITKTVAVKPRRQYTPAARNG